MSRRMRRTGSLTMVGLTVALVALGCGAGAGPASPSSVGPRVSPDASPSGSPRVEAAIVGSWHRAQSCAEMKAAFEGLGLDETHREFLAGNFFGDRPVPSSGDVCAGAIGPLEHQHEFTAAGAFNSHDEVGKQVDDGDVRIEADRMSFPSHATEFGYAGDLLVRYSISGDVATFVVSLAASCEGTCRDAYAWAASAFASGPWQRENLP